MFVKQQFAAVQGNVLWLVDGNVKYQIPGATYDALAYKGGWYSRYDDLTYELKTS